MSLSTQVRNEHAAVIVALAGAGLREVLVAVHRSVADALSEPSDEAVS